MASAHIITIDIGEAIGTLKETLRSQLATFKVGGKPIGIGLIDDEIRGRFDGLALIGADLEHVLDNLARNLAQALYGLEVQG